MNRRPRAGFIADVAERKQLEDFVADADGGGFVGGEEGVVFFLVDEVALEFYEVGGEEDVGAEGGEEGVEGGGGGGGEDWEGAWGGVLVHWILHSGSCSSDEMGGIPCFRRAGVVVKARAWEDS